MKIRKNYNPKNVCHTYLFGLRISNMETPLTKIVFNLRVCNPVLQ